MQGRREPEPHPIWGVHVQNGRTSNSLLTAFVLALLRNELFISLCKFDLILKLVLLDRPFLLDCKCPACKCCFIRLLLDAFPNRSFHCLFHFRLRSNHRDANRDDGDFSLACSLAGRESLG